MKSFSAIALFLAVLITLQFEALGWNIPGHMLSGAIAYQILQRESPNDDSECSLSPREKSLVPIPLEITTGQTTRSRT
jgi:hypothetical protein